MAETFREWLAARDAADREVMERALALVASAVPGMPDPHQASRLPDDGPWVLAWERLDAGRHRRVYADLEVSAGGWEWFARDDDGHAGCDEPLPWGAPLPRCFVTMLATIARGGTDA